MQLTSVRVPGSPVHVVQVDCCLCTVQLQLSQKHSAQRQRLLCRDLIPSRFQTQVASDVTARAPAPGVPPERPAEGGGSASPPYFWEMRRLLNRSSGTPPLCHSFRCQTPVRPLSMPSTGPDFSHRVIGRMSEGAAHYRSREASAEAMLMHISAARAVTRSFLKRLHPDATTEG